MNKTLIDNLIPVKYIPVVYDLDNQIVLKKLEKSKLRKQFLGRVKNLFKEFIELDDKKIDNDFYTLEQNEYLKLTDYDKECVNYNIQPLNMAEIYRLLDDLYFEQIYRMYLIIDQLLILGKDMFKEKEFRYITEKNFKLTLLDIKFKEICYGKNLADLYENRVGWARQELKYLIRYSNALI